MTKIGSLLVLLMGLLVPHLSWAVNVTATVDRNEMGEGDTLTLSVSINSGSSVNVDQPRLPDLSGFDLINNWTESQTRATFINGQFQSVRTQKFNYLLAPKAKGNYKIGPAQVVVDGQSYNTKPIDIKVIAGQAAPPPSKKRRRGRPFNNDEDLFTQFLRQRPRPGFKSQPVNPKEAFFIQVEVDKTDVYAGEQVTASWYLYTRGQISDIDTLKYPSLNGFWKEDIEVATRLNFTQEIINGVPYRKALLASYALFPIKPGKAKIDQYKARCTVVTPTNFGFGRPYQYTKASKEVKINVKPVPAEGRPSDFTGAVGFFDVSSSLDTATIAANEPVTLKMRFDGKGNAKLIDLPSLDLPESIELYDTKKEQKFFKNGNSYREFEVYLIPREEGDFVLPGISVSIFDPNKGEFYTRKTRDLKLKVLPGKNQNAIPSSPLAEGQVPTENPIAMPGLQLSYQGSVVQPILVNNYFWLVSYLLAALVLVWKAFRELSFGKRRKDVKEVVNERFKLINESVDAGDWRKVGAGTLNVFYYLLGEISGLGGANMELEKLMLKAPPSVRRELGEDLLKMLRKFEILGFAPEEVVGALKEKKELKKSVSDMEKLLKEAIRLGLGSEFEDNN